MNEEYEKLHRDICRLSKDIPACLFGCKRFNHEPVIPSDLGISWRRGYIIFGTYQSANLAININEQLKHFQSKFPFAKKTMNDYKNDTRWCLNGDKRYTEFGVVGAEQADETHFDGRSQSSQDEEATAEGRIKFSQRKLYGRDKELTRCMEIYQSQSRPAAVFFSGYSGCGKSRLVEEFVRQVSSIPRPTKESTKTPETPGYPVFLSSKYEAMQSSSPLSAISTLVDSVDQRTMESLSHIRSTIQEALGGDSIIVRKVFPNLLMFLETNAGSSHTDTVDSESLVSAAVSVSSVSETAGNMSSPGGLKKKKKKKLNKERLIFALKFFFQLLAAESNRPLILFLDDLQWADMLSLELLQSMATDPKMENLFIMGAYRSNEVDDKHPLAKMIEKIEEIASDKDFAVGQMELKELTIEDIGEFIADSLRLQVNEVQPLTQAVFTKTLGNPFFTRQALEQLVRKNALYYDTISFAWSCNLRQKELEDLVSDDLVEMVKSKISHMGPDMQEVLTAASCTKSTFDVDTLLVLLQPKFQSQSSSSFVLTTPSQADYIQEKGALIELLEQAVEDGLLVRPSKNLSASSPRNSYMEGASLASDIYSFAHDRVQEAARSLITTDRESSFLKRIGGTLYDRAISPYYGQDWMYFAACEHLNRASRVSFSDSSLREDEKEDDTEDRYRLARLNLLTAELSMDLLAFPAVIDFCENGIDNLPVDEDERWSERYYDMTLRMYSMCAEAQFGVGNIEKAEKYCDKVFRQRLGKKPRVPIHDAIAVSLVYLDIIVGHGKEKVAIARCLELLEELGVTIPKDARLQRAKIWWSLKQFRLKPMPTEESMQKLPHVADPVTLGTMEILFKAANIAYTEEESTLYVMLCCEAVKWIFEHGLTDDSAGAIASFANVLMHVHGDFKSSRRLAELAILISDRQKSKFNETRPLNTANANVLGWVRPIKSCLKYHERAYKSGITSGNLNGAFIGKIYVCWVQLFGSCPLGDLDTECRVQIPIMRQMGQTFCANFCSIAWQIALNFLGRPGSDNKTLLVGEAMDANTDLYQKTPPYNIVHDALRSFAFVLFGDFEAGAADALKRGDIYSQKAIGTMYGFEPFLRAMSLIAMARRNDHPDRKAYKKEANRLLKHLKMIVKKGCVNLDGPVRLLEAEAAALQRKSKIATATFEGALTILQRGGFHQFEGLASERFSLYLREQGDLVGARLQLSNAKECYIRWGAWRKVQVVEQQINTIGRG